MADRTPWAIICPNDGQVFLTREQYDLQMNRANARWKCPHCLSICEFDDENYDRRGLEEDQE